MAGFDPKRTLAVWHTSVIDGAKVTGREFILVRFLY